MTKIDLTKEQYESLLKLAYLGNWMVNGSASEADGDHEEKYTDLLSHLLSSADQFGLKHLAEVEDGTAFPSPAFEEDPEIEHYLEEYTTATFWEALIQQLSMRDVMRKFEGKSKSDVSEDEALKALFQFRDQYGAEFAAHGIDSVDVKFSTGHSTGKSGKSGCCDHGSHSHSHE